ncbi:DNA-formamidopyrimidine glycosylase [Candidatus Formimonas warabiya]|uniref:Formamidopyrimidine-DNA glycosylase n=1 Tax=Formimonas warabiya TaxID=1761012 RepID=A0A3G1KMY6_FORW1|nr:DNA-formamidopyrimidine glycosylase [Candidatus Formimonas warabiya]ATW23780.1 DNA-formamidopyrimidine glycosylase [Candidatus Formimonas warabiya]
MPELPEVETVKRTLAEHILGLTVTGITLNQEIVIKTPGIQEFREKITGQSFRNIDRRGKYLIFALSQGSKMVVHLRMTGQLVYCEQDHPLKKHTHVIFSLDNGRELRFVDQRRFGRIWLVPEKEIDQISGLCSLGPEPLGEEFTLENLKENLAGKKSRIKLFLLDQSMIAGIGNIYADEILYRCGIHPERTAGSLCHEEMTRLFEEIRSTLGEAVEHRGTTFSDYVDGRGDKGAHQHFLNVYQQVGKKCPRCGTAVERVKVGSRSAYHCPGCQK